MSFTMLVDSIHAERMEPQYDHLGSTVYEHKIQIRKFISTHQSHNNVYSQDPGTYKGGD